MRRAIERAARQQGEAQEFSCRLGEGPAARDLRGSIGPLTDENGDNSLFLLTLLDRTQEMMIERNLRRELVSDSLIGLPTRAEIGHGSGRGRVCPHVFISVVAAS